MFSASFSVLRISRVNAATALGLILSLGACGGYTAVDVGGTITGLTGPGLQLANGNSVISVDAATSTFIFPSQVEIRSPYSISIVAQPARQNCAVVNGAGIAGAAPVTVVNIVCSPNTYALGGRVTGLTGSNLILTNGSDQLTIAGGDVLGNASFTFATAVADGAAYGVAVLAQPSGQACNVFNGTAVMGSGPINTVQVNCL